MIINGMEKASIKMLSSNRSQEVTLLIKWSIIFNTREHNMDETIFKRPI